jgi:hypothetical protein
MRYDLLVDDCMRAYYGGATSPEMLWRLCSYVAWTQQDQAFIRDIHEQIIPLRLNRIQRTVIGAMMAQALEEKPIRVIVLKARKGGTSTNIQALLFFLCAHFPNQHAYMLAHHAESTDEIFAIAKVLQQHYRGGGRKYAQSLLFGEGSRYHCHTAGGEGIGAGMTVNLLHKSELALWHHNREETDYTVTEAVPRVPTSLIVEESTARGRELFFDRFEAARAATHPYIGVFIPWFMDERLTLEGAAMGGAMGDPVGGRNIGLSEDEQLLLRLAQNEYGLELSTGQLAWRRERLEELGELVFRQEYPATPEEAVQGAQGLVVPGLRGCVVDALAFDYANVSDPQARVGGIDHGYNDPTVVLTAVHLDQVLYVVDLYRASGQIAEAHIAGIHPGHTYYCDPAGTAARHEMEASLQRLNGQDVHLLPAPRKAESGQQNYVNAEWELLRKRIVMDRLRILSGHADQLILEADNLFWNQRTGLPDMVRGDAWGHFDCLDALRYACMGLETPETPRLTAMPTRITRRQAWRLV